MKLLIVIFLIIANTAHPLAYDSAIYKAQKGNWQDAHSTLSTIITDNPDRADVVYDAGVAAYNLGNKCQAATCFTRAAECSTNKNITFCAHFNAGNTYVDEKKLELALAEYDKALAIEPDNEYARHNRDRVAQMLQEQQQKDDKQKQEQNKDQEKNDQNKDDEQQDKQDGNDQQKDNQEGQDQKDQNQNQDGNDQQSSHGNDKKDGKQNQQGNDKQNQESDSSQDESSNQQSQGDRDQRDAADNRKNTQRQEHGKNKKEDHQNSADNKKRDGNDKLEKQPQDAQREGNEQQGDKHGTTPDQQNIDDDKSNVSADDGQEQAITDPWLLRILNDQEMHDKAVNKQLMEAKIRQHGGKHGQNCW